MTESKPDIVGLVGELIAGLHVPRSFGSLMVPKAYDDLRNAINDFGWSASDEVAERLRAALNADGHHCAGCDGSDTPATVSQS